MLNFKIKDNVLEESLYVFIGKREECAQKLKILGVDLCEYNRVNAQTGMTNNEENYIWLKEFKNTPKYIAILSHELIHTVNRIFGIKGIFVSNKQNEIFAYYHEFWLRECLKKLIC